MGLKPKEALMCILLMILLSPCVIRSAKLELACNQTLKVNCSVNNSLSQALGEAQSVDRSVCIELSSGTCFLDSPVNTIFSHRKSGLAIVGTENQSGIRCNNIGFTFLYSSEIVFVNVTFEFCGVLHNSTSRNYSIEDLAYMEFSSALFFLFCSNVTMKRVIISHSFGSGLVMYNTVGLNVFNSCTFQHSRMKNGPGGSGVMIDFSYCVPGDIHCTSGDTRNVDSYYTFTDCSFSYNNATYSDYFAPSYPHGTERMVFGKGGGVSISFGGQSIKNTIKFSLCTFMLNMANAGGGLYAHFGDISINNSLLVENSRFSANTLDCIANQFSSSSGGGAKIEFIYYPSDQFLWPRYTALVEGNHVEFINSTFDNNIACYGGAVSFVTSRASVGINSNRLSFDSCKFTDNKGQLSSAVDLSLHYPDRVGSPGLPIEPLFTNCTFKHNCVEMGNINHYFLGMGALYSARVPFKLAGNTKFIHNVGTALVALSTYVNATDFSVTEFSRNTGRLGGAVALIGNAWLIAHSYSSFSFNSNTVEAGGLGGAIYSAHFGEHNFQQNCFFQYHKPTVHPSDWLVRFTFTNNLADDSPNSIYATSVQPCIWPNNTTNVSSKRAFCDGHPWYFNGSNCSEQILTASSTLRVPPAPVQAVPGWPTSLHVTAIDDYDKQIPTVLVAFPDKLEDTETFSVSNWTRYISNDQIVLHGIENHTSPSPLLKLRTLDPRVIVSKLPVGILSCPPGFVSKRCSNHPEMTCDCVCPTTQTAGMSCDYDNQCVTLDSHYCLTYQYDSDNRVPNKSQHIVLGKCPYNIRRIDLPNHTDKLDDVVCGPFNRTGLLCSDCRENYGVAINSHYECVPCDPRTGWLMFVAVKVVPVTVLFLLIALLNIKATSPAMNAFVFYGQIVSIAYFYNPYPFYFGVLTWDANTRQILIALVELSYSFLNLDFFRNIVPPFCVGNIETLVAIALNYIVAFYPIILMLVLYICIKLYDRNVRVVRFMWRPFKWCLAKLHHKKKPTTSIIDAFATFFLFSYTNFVCITFPLLLPVTVLDARSANHTPLPNYKFYFDATLTYFGSAHFVIIFISVMFFIGAYIVVPPLFLILYPFKCTQRCISKLPKNIALKTFAESLNECFKNGTERKGGWDYRSFAGLYFLFRIAILAVFVADLNWLEQYFIQQILFTLGMLLFAMARPYKKDIYNYLDTCMFGLLALQNALSSYNSRKDVISLPVFIINYVLVFVPLLYFVVYIVCYCLFTLRCLSKCYTVEPNLSESFVEDSHNSSLKDSDVEVNGDFPDRLLNPQNYHKNSQQPAASPKVSCERNAKDTFNVSTEKSYFLGRRKRQELQAYGSIQTD